MENNVCFLVSSAVATKFGDTHKRALMTINTLSTINANCPGSKIVLLECGQEPIPKFFLEHFPPNVTIVPYWDDSNILKIIEEAKTYRKIMKIQRYNKDSLDRLELGYIKSRTETYVFNKFISSNEFKNIDYVFKFSGRYCLTPKFKPSDWIVDGKICFSKPIPSPFKELGDSYMYATWLWGFSTKILDEVREYYSNTVKCLTENWLQGKIIDIEHALWKSVPQEMVQIIDQGKVGVICFDMGGKPNNNCVL
tara:strand:+ start:3238 stop:3993 length:756 start_codon:yes stop_codon:yes gene_type:complete